jgi:hypothetical protein
VITLKTLPTATEVEVFEHIAKHLLTQLKKSQVGETCLYRHHDLKCAAGCLIGDDEYTYEMEGNSWSVLVEERMAPDAHWDLIRNMQCLHDFGIPTNWERDLRAWADRLGSTMFEGGE